MQSVRCFIRKVVTAAPGVPLSSIAQLMQEHNIGAVVIADHHKPVGIIMDRDLALALGVQGLSLSTSASQVMTSPVTTLHQDDSVFHFTTRILRESGVRRPPIVDDDGELVGIVTFDDMLRVLVRELSNLIESIKPEMEVKGLK